VSIVFHRDGTVAADDSVNNYSGDYAVTGDQLVVSNTIGTLVGTTGGNQVTFGVLGAMAAVLSGKPVNARVTGDQLVLAVEQYILTFQAAGPAAEPSPVASTTPVSSPTGAPPSYVNGSELPS
jgi:hypothetical protein